MALEPGKLNREKNKYGLYCSGNGGGVEWGGGVVEEKKKKTKVI